MNITINSEPKITLRNFAPSVTRKVSFPGAWTLGNSINGFTLAPGQKWHRVDGWKKEWLPAGTRPLLENEYPVYKEGDVFWKDEYLTRPFSDNNWDTSGGSAQQHTAWGYYRTRRSLPDPYAILKAAKAAGKTLQAYVLGTWDELIEHPQWNIPPDRYRIKPEPDAYGWIPHDGTGCPVADKYVDGVKYKDGSVTKTYLHSDCVSWHHVTHYKVFSPPAVIPWDFNSRPREVVWVYRKGHITDSMITAWGDDCVVISTKNGPVTQTYRNLLENYLQRDGTPCGTQNK